MESSINWREVRKRGIDLGLRTDRAIANAAGLHYNSIGKEGPYMSTTLDKLATLFKCARDELITIKKAGP
jgi:hypothetical protein